jgi:hypothetical protein
MDLNEARKVVWIGSNRRPLGELLDIGYLNKERLEWAVAHVNNTKVQQAATVLLGWVKRTAPRSPNRKPVIYPTLKPLLPGLDLKISLEQARAVIWPFPPYKGEPMGPLIESRKLSLKDLGFAIENAWEEKVKQAAIAFSAIRLSQEVKEPLPSKGHVQVISGGRKFSEKRQLSLTLLQGTILGILLGICISVIFYNLEVQQNQSPRLPITAIFPYPIIIISIILFIALIFILLAVFLIIFQLLMNTLDKKIENYRLGQEGEDRIVDKCRILLNGEWTLFRNIILPGRRGDLDFVLVGPTGVWTLEIKTYIGQFRNIGEQWDCLTAKKWKSIKMNPGQQARKNAGHLGGFLAADGIKVWVNPVVAWANPESPLEVNNPSVAVWPLDRLEDELGNIQEGKKIAEADRKKICEKLTRLIDRRK